MKKAVYSIQNYLLPDYTGQAFSYGNKKIPQNTLIVNLTSAQHCPSQALGLCKVADVCYALKCERIYPNYKAKNLIMEKWLRDASTTDIIKLMEAYIDNAPMPINYIRLDEAGDFRGQNQVNQWNKIAYHFWRTRGIRTYTYTARADLDFTNARYICVNGSLPGIQGAAREFKCIPAPVYDAMTVQQGQYKCPGNCNICHMCFTDRNSSTTIYCRKH